MKIMPIILCLMLLGLGCTAKIYHLIEPIEPKPAGGHAYIYWYTPISTLQPEFLWKEMPGASSYDFILYRAVMVKGLEAGWDRVASPGAEVYYEEGIAEPRFILPVTLEPDTDYVWSVRTRSEEGVSDWATYDAVNKWDHKIYKDVLFWIRTPKD